MKTRLSRTHLIAAGVIAGAFAIGFATGPALATEPETTDEPFQFKFDYSPEELVSQPAAERLLVRLERSVRRECGDTSRKMTIEERRLVRTCVDETMRSAVNRIGSEAVAEAFKSRAAG